MPRPRICVSVSARDPPRAAEAIRGAEPYEPDLIELRIDHLESLEGLEEIRGSTDIPLIATNRRRDQGGRFQGREEERVAELLGACRGGFDYVDLELTTPSLRRVADEVRGHGAGLILSFHDLGGTPPREGLKRILMEELGLGADICKIVGTATSYLDNLTYLSFLGERRDVKLVCFGMGRLGTVSRVLSPLFGAEFTYASMGTGLETAPGQLTVGALREIYRMLGV